MVTSNFYYVYELHESNELLFMPFVLLMLDKKRIFSGSKVYYLNTLRFYYLQ